MAAIRDFRLVSVSPQLQPFQPSPMDEVCLRAHDTTGAVPGLHAHYVIGQDQDNRRPDTPPNQGREPPLVWSVEFMKKVIHIESNDNSPLGFPLVARTLTRRFRTPMLPHENKIRLNVAPQLQQLQHCNRNASGYNGRGLRTACGSCL